MKSKNGEVNLCVEQMDPRIRLNQLNELDRTFRKSQTEHVKKQKSDIVLNWSRMDAAKRFEQLLFFSVYLRYGLKEVFLYQRMKEVLKRSCPRNFSASTLLYALSNREYSRFFLWDPRLVAAYTNAVLKDVWSDEEQEVGVCCTLDASYIEYYQRMPIQFSVEELVWALCDYVVWDLDTDSEMLMNEYSKIQNKAEKQLKEKLQKYGAVAYEGNETPASLLTSVAKEVARIKRGIELGYYVGWESVDQMIKRVVLEIIRNESVFQKGDQTRLVSASRLIYFMHQYDAECMLELPQDVAMKEWNTPTVYPAKADYQFQRARLTKTASAFGGYEDDKYQIVYDADEVSCKMMYGSLFSLAMMCRRYDIAKNELDRLGDDNIQFDITYWQYIKQSKQSIMSGDVTGLTYLICNDDGIPKKLLARLLKVERTRYLKYKRREHCEMYNFLGEELWMARPEDADFWEKPKIYRIDRKSVV